MCEECWDEAGRPQIVTAATLATAALIHELYLMPGALAGGHLHVVVDDWNLRDVDLDGCEDEIATWPPESAFVPGTVEADMADPVLLALERRIIAALRPMSELERMSTLALEDGMFDAR